MFQPTMIAPVSTTAVSKWRRRVAASRFFAFVGWDDTTGGRGWKGFAIPVLTAFAGQGLGFPGWTWRTGLRLAIAGLVWGAPEHRFRQ